MACVFLDLDGTLTDPKPGITAAVQYALEKSGLDVPSADDLTWTIGPPLIDSFAKLGAADPQATLEHYRVHYQAGGLFEAAVFPGIHEGLAQMRDAGHRLFVATAKPHAYAKKVTEHFGLTPYFEQEYGPELDGTHNDKADLLAHALEENGISADDAVMVGDRDNDYRAARLNGMRSIAVTWGYGKESEYAQANARLTDPNDFGPGILRFLNAGG